MDKFQAEWAVKNLPAAIEAHWAHRHVDGCAWVIRDQVRTLRKARAAVRRVESATLSPEQLSITDMWAIVGTLGDEYGTMMEMDIQVCSFKDACDQAKLMASHWPDLTFSVYPLRAGLVAAATFRPGK